MSGDIRRGAEPIFDDQVRFFDDVNVFDIALMSLRSSHPLDFQKAIPSVLSLKIKR